MATSITKALADTYYGEEAHLDAAKWLDFDDELRTAAVAQADRLLSRALGSAMTSETVDADAAYRPDYAVFEQSMYMLIHGDAVPNGEQSAPHWAGTGTDGKEGQRMNPLAICPEARKWMDWQYGATIPIYRG